MRYLIRYILFTAFAVHFINAQEITVESHPGCFSDTKRSTLTASKTKGISISVINDLRKDLDSPDHKKMADEVITQLTALELTKKESEILKRVFSITGPDHYVVSIQDGERVISYRYNSMLANAQLSALYEDLYKDDMDNTQHVNLAEIALIEKKFSKIKAQVDLLFEQVDK